MGCQLLRVTGCYFLPEFSGQKKKKKIIDLAVMGLHCCAWAFLAAVSRCFSCGVRASHCGGFSGVQASTVSAPRL